MPSLSTRIGFVALLLAVGTVFWLAQRSATELHRFRTDDPEVWEPVIVGFERDAAESPPPPESVLFLGAATIRFWDTLSEDMAPLPAVGRGFGGAKVRDVLHYAERLLLPGVRAVVVSIGANDLFDMAGSRPSTVDRVATNVESLLLRLRELQPTVPVYYVGIRPPILDPDGRDPSSQVNARVESFAQRTPGISYIEANDGLYQASGRLEDEYRSWNRSQLSREGYAVWSASIRDRLLRDVPPPSAG